MWSGEIRDSGVFGARCRDCRWCKSRGGVLIDAMTSPEDSGAGRPGPSRPAGSPSGPDEVRRAVLDAAASLFARRGVDAVSLREIAAVADVHVALIGRYIGNRDALVLAVFDDLSDQLALEVLEHPLSGQGFEVDTVMGKWVRIAGALAIGGNRLVGHGGFNPVLAMAKTLADGYGLDPEAARLRAAQIVAAALGWRIFEDVPHRGGRARSRAARNAARRAGPLGASARRDAVAVAAGPARPHALKTVRPTRSGPTALGERSPSPT